MDQDDKIAILAGGITLLLLMIISATGVVVWYFCIPEERKNKCCRRYQSINSQQNYGTIHTPTLESGSSTDSDEELDITTPIIVPTPPTPPTDLPPAVLALNQRPTTANTTLDLPLAHPPEPEYRKVVDMQKVECHRCKGDGIVRTKCYKCRGTGKAQEKNYQTGQVTIVECEPYIKRECTTCGGDGYREETMWTIKKN